MCWLCGCADHVGLGNEREPEPESDAFERGDHGWDLWAPGER